MAKERKNPNEVIVDKLLERIESDGLLPWQCKYLREGLPRNYITGRPYQGRNLLMTLASGFNRTGFMTYKQARDHGYQVKKGEHGLPILWASQGFAVEKEVEEENGEKKTVQSWVKGGAKLYYVFNVSQIEGIKEMPEQVEGTDEQIEEFLGKFNIHWVRGKRPAYVPSTDEIEMPMAGDFENESSFYGVLFHELVHWTGKRVGRKQSVEFGNELYSYEELVAEIGSAFLRGHFYIESEEIDENNAAYVKNWLTALQNDKMMILKAATDAQKAVDYLISFNGVEQVIDNPASVEVTA